MRLRTVAIGTVLYSESGQLALGTSGAEAELRTATLWHRTRPTLPALPIPRDLYASGYTAAPGPGPGPGPGPAGLRRRGALMHMRFRKDPGPPAVVSALFLIASTWRRKVCKCRRMFLLILTRGAKASV